MKISALKVLVAQALEQQEQGDVLEGPLPERRQRERRELGDQRPASRLETEFIRAENPERLRVISPPTGDLYDVFISTVLESGEQWIGVRPLQLKLVYPPEYDVHKSWEAAMESLPQDWLVYEVFGGEAEQQVQAGEKKLMAFTSGDKVFMLKFIDDGPPED